MKRLIEKWKKLNKFVRISICIVLGVSAYRCADFFPHTYMWLTHHPQMYNAELEPEFPSWFSVNFGSLEGPDTNKNGIRDDVEIYMNREFEDLDEEERAILNTYAKRVQFSVENSLGDKSYGKYWEERNHYFNCIFILGELKFGRHSKLKYSFLDISMKFIRDKTHNTFSRDLKHNKFMSQFNGRSTGSVIEIWSYLHLEEQCHFNERISNKLRMIFFDKKSKAFGKYGERFYDYYERKYGKSKRYLYKDYID